MAFGWCSNLLLPIHEKNMTRKIKPQNKHTQSQRPTPMFYCMVFIFNGHYYSKNSYFASKKQNKTPITKLQLPPYKVPTKVGRALCVVCLKNRFAIRHALHQRFLLSSSYNVLSSDIPITPPSELSSCLTPSLLLLLSYSVDDNKSSTHPIFSLLSSVTLAYSSNTLNT